MGKFKHKIGFTGTAQKRLGNTMIYLYRPILSEQEREKHKKAVYRAVLNCLNAKEEN